MTVPASRRSGDRNSEAAAPLLGDDGSNTPRDTRFAISEEDAEDPYDANREDPGEGDESGPAEGAQYKYPPSSLPPSYRDAIYSSGRDPWYKSEVALSVQHYGRACLSSLMPLLKRYWPTSRFAQAGFFIIGLWLIVIASGPTWDQSTGIKWGKSVDEVSDRAAI